MKKAETAKELLRRLREAKKDVRSLEGDCEAANDRCDHWLNKIFELSDRIESEKKKFSSEIDKANADYTESVKRAQQLEAQLDCAHDQISSLTRLLTALEKACLDAGYAARPA